MTSRNLKAKDIYSMLQLKFGKSAALSPQQPQIESKDQKDLDVKVCQSCHNWIRVLKTFFYLFI